MRRRAGLLCLTALVAAAPSGAAFPSGDEDLHYSVNWPSGLSIGEAHLEAHESAGRWEFQLAVDAAIPGFRVSDRYRSVASGDFCSLEFEKSAAHGNRRTMEKTTIDPKKRVARRWTNGGGRSEIATGPCARDALDFLYFARSELAQGRMPPPQTVLFGAAYELRAEYAGTQVVSVNEKRVEADAVSVAVKGPASDTRFEIFFARDPGRTPVLVRAPLSVGTFSVELVR